MPASSPGFASTAARIDAIEEAYEFCLAYAAQGRRGDEPGSEIRRFLQRALGALDGAWPVLGRARDLRDRLDRRGRLFLPSDGRRLEPLLHDHGRWRGRSRLDDGGGRGRRASSLALRHDRDSGCGGDRGDGDGRAGIDRSLRRPGRLCSQDRRGERAEAACERDRGLGRARDRSRRDPSRGAKPCNRNARDRNLRARSPAGPSRPRRSSASFRVCRRID